LGKKNEPEGIYRNLTSYGDVEFSKYMRRAFLASAGYDAEDLDRPIVGIADTSSDYNPCHRQMPVRKKGVRNLFAEMSVWTPSAEKGS